MTRDSVGAWPIGEFQRPVVEPPDGWVKFDPMGPWAKDGACRGLDPDLFFPGRGQDSASPKALCAGCPVKAPCYEWAWPQPDLHGIWGGTSEKQRRKARAAATRRRHGNMAALVSGETAEMALPRNKGELYMRLQAVKQSVDASGWMLVAFYEGRRSAKSTAQKLRTGTRDAPSGIWEYRWEADEHGSYLYARFVGEDLLDSEHDAA